MHPTCLTYFLSCLPFILTLTCLLPPLTLLSQVLKNKCLDVTCFHSVPYTFYLPSTFLPTPSLLTYTFPPYLHLSLLFLPHLPSISTFPPYLHLYSSPSYLTDSGLKKVFRSSFQSVPYIPPTLYLPSLVLTYPSYLCLSSSLSNLAGSSIKKKVFRLYMFPVFSIYIHSNCLPSHLPIYLLYLPSL